MRNGIEANRGIAYRGVSYDTGSNFDTGQGNTSRVVWDKATMLDEIGAISEQLHCNSITLYGSDLTRLADAATAAAEHGLNVWLQPRLLDRPQQEILDHFAEAARFARSLREQGAGVAVITGAEHLIVTPGIVPGEAYHERLANLFPDVEHNFLVPTGTIDMVGANQRLNEFLDRAVRVVREQFDGPVTYSAPTFEDVDWRRFDLVALTNLYSYHPTRQGYLDELTAYRTWDRPVIVTEYGTASYAGAVERGIMCFDVVDRSDPQKPRVLDGYVRDERVQAEFHLRMLDIFEEAGIVGVSPVEFIHPTHPHSSDPALDLDIASTSLVRTIRDRYDDPSSGYRWEPKESFRAIAERYAAAQARETGTTKGNDR